MRDIIITLIVFGALPLVLVRPWLGILLWSWIGYMNPHRLSWGFAFEFPFAQVVAIATLLGFLVTRERRPFLWNGLTAVWIAFLTWMTITSFFALDQVAGWEWWRTVMKIQLFAFLSFVLIHGRERVMALVAVIVLSLGFFGVKGGLFVFATDGENLVWGPPGSFISDNNALALSLIMTIPLMWFMFQESQGRLARGLFGFMMIATCAAILGSQSRGAALAGSAMLFVLWLKSSRKLKIRLGLAMLATLPFLLMVMPKSYFERVETISTYEQDGSAMGRIRAWRFATEMAIERPIGGGFASMVEENYRRFSPAIAEEIDRKANSHFPDAHSIYFRVIGEHGFVGFALFLMLGISAYRQAGAIAREVQDRPGLEWLGRLAPMLQVSLVGYAVGGAFLALSYFDLYYALVALVVSLRITLRDSAVTEEPAGEQPDSGWIRDGGFAATPPGQTAAR
jgi:probable O-glycosylation ligase (exosortase A-associated)